MRFKKGSKVMGFHHDIQGEILKADVVKEVKIGSGYAGRDRYILETSGLLNDKESVEFDGLKFKQAEIFVARANELEKQVYELRKMARDVIYSGGSK